MGKKEENDEIALTALAEEMARRNNISVYVERNGIKTSGFYGTPRADKIDPHIVLRPDQGLLLITDYSETNNLSKPLAALQSGLKMRGIPFDAPTEETPLTIKIRSLTEMRYLGDLMHSNFAPRADAAKEPLREPGTALIVRERPKAPAGTPSAQESGYQEKNLLDRARAIAARHGFNFVESGNEVVGMDPAKPALDVYEKLDQVILSYPKEQEMRQTLGALIMNRLKVRQLHSKKALIVSIESPEDMARLDKSLAHVRAKGVKNR
jgi:hypothetical protein